jgi:hypothetical protein
MIIYGPSPSRKVINQFFMPLFCSRRKYLYSPIVAYIGLVRMFYLVYANDFAKLCLYLLKGFLKFPKQKETFSFHLFSDVPQFFFFQTCPAKNDEDSHDISIQKSVRTQLDSMGKLCVCKCALCFQNSERVY